MDWAFESHADFWNTKTYRLFFGGKTAPDAEKVTEGVALFDKFNKQMEKHLATLGSPYMAGDRITIADFLIFSLYMTIIFNESTGAPDVMAQFAATLADTPKVNEYVARMKQEMAAVLAQRGAYVV